MPDNDEETPLVPLEFLELHQQIATLKEELKYYRNRCARQQRYIDGQMKPLVTMGIVQGGKIVTLERKLARLLKAKKSDPFSIMQIVAVVQQILSSLRK